MLNYRQKCPECSGTWFREVRFQEFARATLWPQELTGSRERYTWICLCGAPLTPQVTNQRPETRRFLEHLKQAQNRGKMRADVEFLLHGGGVERQQLQALQPRLQALDRAAGRRLAQQQVAAGRRDPRGRRWRPPGTASACGSKGRDWLERQLQQRGLTSREAHAVLRAVLEAMQAGLRRDGWLETPLGEFYRASRTLPYERKRWGCHQYLHLRRTRIKFAPDPSLLGNQARTSQNQKEK